MSRTLSTTIKGVALPEPLLLAALEQVPAAGFDKSEFAAALSREGFGKARDRDLVRRAMQFLKRQGMIDYSSTNGAWTLTATGQARVPQKTLPLIASPATALAPPLSNAPSVDRVDRLAEHARLAVSALACLTLIAALVGLNASFAWELGREARQFQVLIMAGLMALDLMRPGFVMVGFYLNGRGHLVAGSTALAVALFLSPVSILSTTSILSASFLLGAEFNQYAAVRSDTRQVLQAEHGRLLERAAQDEAAWRQECARGGCGPVAQELEAAFQRTLTEAQTTLDQIVTLAEAEQGSSELLARMVTTFEGLGLFGTGRQILLPLFLAISLELGALFGPVLLLRRRT